MNENRLADYLDHMQQAAMDACAFVEGLAQEDFRQEKRYPAGRHHEPHHPGRGRHQGDGRLPRFCAGTNTGAVAQYARHAQPHCPR